MLLGLAAVASTASPTALAHASMQPHMWPHVWPINASNSCRGFLWLVLVPRKSPAVTHELVSASMVLCERRVWLAGPLAGLRTFLQSRQEIYAIAPIGVGQRKLKVI